MTRISYKRHRFPAAVIQHAVWLYFRFTLSFRDVEEMLAHRGVDVSYETVRAWTVKFGPKIAANLRRRKMPPSPRWHLDEMVSWIGGEHVWIWRAVDDEGEVMDMIVQKLRDAGAAFRFLRRLLKNQPVEPETIVTDGLRSYRAALDRLGLLERHRPGRLRETIVLRTHISPFEDGSARCKASRVDPRRSVFFRRMLLSTTRSTYSGIC